MRSLGKRDHNKLKPLLLLFLILSKFSWAQETRPTEFKGDVHKTIMKNGVRYHVYYSWGTADIYKEYVLDGGYSQRAHEMNMKFYELQGKGPVGCGIPEVLEDGSLLHPKVNGLCIAGDPYTTFEYAGQAGATDGKNLLRPDAYGIEVLIPDAELVNIPKIPYTPGLDWRVFEKPSPGTIIQEFTGQYISDFGKFVDLINKKYDVHEIVKSHNQFWGPEGKNPNPTKMLKEFPGYTYIRNLLKDGKLLVGSNAPPPLSIGGVANNFSVNPELLIRKRFSSIKGVLNTSKEIKTVYTNPTTLEAGIRRVVIAKDGIMNKVQSAFCGPLGKSATKFVKTLMSSAANDAMNALSLTPLIFELSDPDRNPFATEPIGVACSLAAAMKNKIACELEPRTWFSKSNENVVKCYTYSSYFNLGVKGYFNGLDHHKDWICMVKMPYLVLKVDDTCKAKLDKLGVFKDPYKKVSPPLPPTRKMFDWLKFIKQMGCTVIDSNGSEEGIRFGYIPIEG